MRKPPYKNKAQLKQAYEKLGSTRRVARHYGVSNGTVIRWMRKYHLPRIPKLHLFDNPSGWGRLCELYISGHPHFKQNLEDFGRFDDKSKFDGLWNWDRINIKSTHSKKRQTFRIKKRKHDVAYYICCVYDDEIDPLIPFDIYIIPAKDAPRTTITISTNFRGKYRKYSLKMKTYIEFTIEEEIAYDEHFKKKYKVPKSR